jgi:hypothetical protein
VQRFMLEGIKMRENQAKVRELQNQFSPPYFDLSSNPQRVFVFKGDVNRMEDNNPKERQLWLFSDILVCSRVSEWLNRGSYRHLNTLEIKAFGDAHEFGPHAWFVRGTAGEKWVMISGNFDNKATWFEKLAICPTAVNETRRRASGRVKSGGGYSVQLGQATVKAAQQSATRLIAHSSQPSRLVAQAAPPPPPPPPPPRLLPPGWVELLDAGSGKVYYYNAAQQRTQWDLPAQ